MTSAKFNEVYTWGSSSTKGKLGHGESGRKPALLKQLKGLGPLYIAVGEAHSAVIVDSGKDVYMWGSNERGQLGRGDTESQPVPRLVIALRDRRICRIACGNEHTLALSAAGVVYVYGSNSRGQLGLGGAAPKYVCDPDVLKGPWEASNAAVSRISCGAYVSAAVTDAGKLYVWGDGYDGLLGNGDLRSDMASPLLLSAMQRHMVSDVQFGARHALALTAAGEVFSWGSHKVGELGLGPDAPERVDTPTEIILPFKGKRIVQIACGTSHSACLVANGDVFSFGLGSSGQVGVGNRLNQFSPMKVLFPASIRGDKVSHLACGTAFSMALTERGRVYTWGAGGRNQLGHGDRKDVLSPRWMDSLQSMMVQQLVCGGDSAAVLTGRIGANPMDVFKGIGKQTITQTQTINVFVGTYNINAQKQCFSARSLQTWLINEGGASGFPNNEPPHVYAIGIQELVNLNSSAVAKDIVEIEGSEMKCLCEHQIEQTINVNGLQYVQVCSRQLVGAMLCLYVLKELESQITRLEWDTVRVGVMGKMGNKGAVAVRFALYDSQFCFINSHFAAGLGKVEKRNKDYRDTSSRLRFPASDGRELTVFDHENIFWFGDFNYRLNDVTKEYVKQVIQQERYQDLYALDQLTIERQAERVFLGFKEGKIMFPPTYKYDPFTTQYDTSEKNRTPAWCDRVLWRGESITLLEYRRHELLCSDHRPVSALFVCTIKRKQDSTSAAAPLSISLRPKATSVFNMTAPAEFADYPDNLPTRVSVETESSEARSVPGLGGSWTQMSASPADGGDGFSQISDRSPSEPSDSDDVPGEYSEAGGLDARSDYTYPSPGSSPGNRTGWARGSRLRAQTFDVNMLAAMAAQATAEADALNSGDSKGPRMSAPVESLSSNNWLQSYPELPRTPSSASPPPANPAAPSSRQQQSSAPPAFLPDYPARTRLSGGSTGSAGSAGSGGSHVSISSLPAESRPGDPGGVRSPQGISLSSFSPPRSPASGTPPPPDAIGGTGSQHPPSAGRSRSSQSNSPSRPPQPKLPDRGTKPKQTSFSPLVFPQLPQAQPLVGAHGLAVAGTAEAPFGQAAQRRPQSPANRAPSPALNSSRSSTPPANPVSSASVASTAVKPDVAVAAPSPVVSATHGPTHPPTPPPPSSESPAPEGLSASEGPVASPEHPLEARVLYDYQAENDEELSLRGGELLSIVAVDASGWWQAVRGTEHGWVPKPFLELCDSSAVQPPAGTVSASAAGFAPAEAAAIHPVASTSSGETSLPSLSPDADDDMDSPPASAPPSRFGSFSSRDEAPAWTGRPRSYDLRQTSRDPTLGLTLGDSGGDATSRRRASQADPVDLPGVDDSAPGTRSSAPAASSRNGKPATTSRRDRADSDRARDRLTELSDVAMSGSDQTGISGFDFTSPPLKQGYLSKRGHVRKNWKTRFFVLRSDSLAYYENQHAGRPPKGVIELRDVASVVRDVSSVDRRGQVRHVLRLYGRKDHEIECQSADELNGWVGAIERAMSALKH